MRKRRLQGAEGEREEETAALRPASDEGGETKEDEDEVERIEVPPDHWLIKRRWKIVRRRNKLGDGSAKDDQEGTKKKDEDGALVEGEEDGEYEYEVDKRGALIFFLTRLVAIAVVFFLLHALFHHYVWDPLNRPRETPIEEQIRKFKALGQL
jgi:hypothetical protein